MRDRHRFAWAVTGPLGWGLGLSAAACCPSVAGPTAPAASYSVTLAAGEVRFFDADTPASTTQINLSFRIESTEALVRLRQVDPGCLPGPGDTCQSFSDSTLPARSAGVVQFGTTLQPHGSRTRVVLENPATDRAVAIGLTIEPRRAGCT
jgi:hypothetical protein